MPKVLNIHRDKIPAGAIYVGRPSKWGNPFVIDKDGTREECIDLYMEWLLMRPHLISQFHELKGHDLVCYCAPKACHADVLLRLAQGAETPNDV